MQKPVTPKASNDMASKGVDTWKQKRKKSNPWEKLADSRAVAGELRESNGPAIASGTNANH